MCWVNDCAIVLIVMRPLTLHTMVDLGKVAPKRLAEELADNVGMHHTWVVGDSCCPRGGNPGAMYGGRKEAPEVAGGGAEALSATSPIW